MAADLFSSLKTSEPLTPPASTDLRTIIAPVPPLIEDGHLVFRCAACRGTAHFGFRRDVKRGALGIWFCAEHKDLGR